MRNAYKMLLGKLKRNKYLKDIGRDGNMGRKY
jgi:hypothetical protein